jgi:hypothetical protein
MKLFLFLIGIAAAGIIGYSFEPDMRLQLTGKIPEPKGQKSKIVRSDGGIAAGETINAATWPADRLPEKVQLKADAVIADGTGDISMTVTAGNRVNLIRVDGENAIISPGPGPFEGTVPVIQTDLIEQLTELAKNPPAEPEPVLPTEMVETGSAEEAVIPAPELVPAPEPEPIAEPQPEPEPIPTAEPQPVAAGSTDVVAVMQASIRGGEIEEFAFDDVVDWQAIAVQETIDGANYQTGIASYKAETVFGVKTIQAKALIEEGKVVRWLWPKSGMEIK